MIKKIYTILVLIKNVLFRKKHYTLSFFAEFDQNLHKTRWFYDFKHLGFDKANLEMVSGADNLCTHYVTQGMDIYPQPKAYKHGDSNLFNNVDYEDISYGELREPTKEELNLYRKYSRELILLGTNKTDYGRNKDNRRT